MLNTRYMNLDEILNTLFNTQSHSAVNQTYHIPPNTQHNASDAFDLAQQIKKRKEQIALEQAELEEIQKQYEDQLSKIRYVADDEKIEMLIPREKMIKLIQGLTNAINDNKDAKSYKVTINL